MPEVEKKLFVRAQFIAPREKVPDWRTYFAFLRNMKLTIYYCLGQDMAEKGVVPVGRAMWYATWATDEMTNVRMRVITCAIEGHDLTQN